MEWKLKVSVVNQIILSMSLHSFFRMNVRRRRVRYRRLVSWISPHPAATRHLCVWLRQHVMRWYTLPPLLNLPHRFQHCTNFATGYRPTPAFSRSPVWTANNSLDRMLLYPSYAPFSIPILPTPVPSMNSVVSVPSPLLRLEYVSISVLMYRIYPLLWSMSHYSTATRAAETKYSLNQIKINRRKAVEIFTWDVVYTTQSIYDLGRENY